MATAMKSAAPLASAATSTLGDDVPIKATWPRDLPKRYIFREIDFEIDLNGFLQFFFLDPTPAQPLPPGGIDDVVADLLAQPVGASRAAFFLTASSPAKQTPLDLNVKETSAYVIYRLRRMRNMIYMPDFHAVTHKEDADMDWYGLLRHVTAAATSADPLDDCKLIYFIAEPPDPDPDFEYVHKFNLKVRLLQRPHVGSTEPRILDIAIDPDIRNPGGSGDD